MTESEWMIKFNEKRIRKAKKKLYSHVYMCIWSIDIYTHTRKHGHNILFFFFLEKKHARLEIQVDLFFRLISKSFLSWTTTTTYHQSTTMMMMMIVALSPCLLRYYWTTKKKEIAIADDQNSCLCFVWADG